MSIARTALTAERAPRGNRPSLPGRLLAGGVALLMAAATIVALASPAEAAGSGPIVGVASAKCLEPSGNKQRSRVVIWDCNGRSDQTWTFTSARELRLPAGPSCLDAASQSVGAIVQVAPCSGGAGQRWAVNPDGSITSVASGLCLAVSGGATTRGSRVELATCTGGANQKWRTPFAVDAQPPTTPANPRVSNLTCTSVVFAWDASTDNVGVTAYDVFHDGQLMTTVSGSTLGATLTVSPGVTWGLYVDARDAAGNVSQASTTVSITPPACQTDTTAPTTPTGLTATTSGTTVTLTWTASSDNVGVRAYDIYRDGVKVGSVTGTAAVPPNTTFVDSGLASSTTYRYTVTARDAAGNTSPPTTAVAVTTAAACGTSVCGVTQVATDTDIPWGLLTLPDGSVLYSRRDAQTIVRLDPATGAKTSVGTVPNVSGTDGEGGLMGLAVSPAFATDHWLYVMHTSPTDNRIVRFQVTGSGATSRLDTASEQVLLSGILRNKYHNGGRLRFGPDGKLYASTGDAQNGDNAQNLSGLNGKILRLNPDGSKPADNPYGSYVWSYGHRNPQGLAFDSQGRLWEQEFGNSVMDETNLIVKGGNYGWPACEGTSGTCGTAGYLAPKYTYPTSEGSCSGIAIVRDVLYVACERGARMYREVISGDTLTGVQAYFTGTYGRLRTVEPAPGGGLWLTTSNLGDKDSIADNSDEKIFHVTLG